MSLRSQLGCSASASAANIHGLLSAIPDVMAGCENRPIGVYRHGRPLRSGLVLLVSILAVAGRRAAAEPVVPPLSAAARGTLKIEGGAIKRLVLFQIAGDPSDPANTPIFQVSPRSIEDPEHPPNQVVLERPAETVLLPSGKYMLTGVELDGGFQCTVPSVYFEIDTGAPRAPAGRGRRSSLALTNRVRSKLERHSSRL